MLERDEFRGKSGDGAWIEDIHGQISLDNGTTPPSHGISHSVDGYAGVIDADDDADDIVRMEADIMDVKIANSIERKLAMTYGWPSQSDDDEVSALAKLEKGFDYNDYKKKNKAKLEKGPLQIWSLS